MRSKKYPSDITREKFLQILPMLESARRKPKPKPKPKCGTVDLHEVLCGMPYLLRTGCQWRALPSDFPKWRTVHSHFAKWAVLLAPAAACCHALSFGGLREPVVAPDPIVGHGVMGRLLARIALALGMPAPAVRAVQPARRESAVGCAVIHPDEDQRKNRTSIFGVRGDAAILNGLISRLAPGGKVALAGFYQQDLRFAFAPARPAGSRSATRGV